MAGLQPGPDGTTSPGGAGEARSTPGRVLRNSFSIIGTLKAPAGFTVYRIRFKVRVGIGGSREESDGNVEWVGLGGEGLLTLNPILGGGP